MSNSEAHRSYLLKNYGSKPKKKKKKKKQYPTHSHSTNTNTNNKRKINDINNVDNSNDNYEMRMPDLNDGSGWQSDPKLLAPTCRDNNASNRKRKHDDTSHMTISSAAVKRAKRQRYDTDSDDDSDDLQMDRNPIQSKIRYDTSDEDDSDIQVTRKSIEKNESESDSDIEVERKPSKMMKDETKNRTVYRDKNGKRISENEYNKLKGKYSKKDDDDMEWASGLVQKYKTFEKQVLMQRQKYESIARYENDAEMNIDLQNEHRNEDPLNQMKGYIHNVNDKKESENKNVLNKRPMYKGKPWPNRYKILPGYRWDGVDRSNSFEGKKLLHDSQRKDRKKKRYRAANSDM